MFYVTIRRIDLNTFIKSFFAFLKITNWDNFEENKQFFLGILMHNILAIENVIIYNRFSKGLLLLGRQNLNQLNLWSKEVYL